MVDIASASPTDLEDLEDRTDGRAVFDKRFDLAFNRVYRFIQARVQDHLTTERLTADVLARAHREFLAPEERALTSALLQHTKQVLREHAEADVRLGEDA